MFNKNDSLVQSVQQVMKENTIRRQIEETVNAEFGVVSRKQLTLEQLSSYDNRLEEAINEALKGNQHKIDANKNNKIDSQDFKILRSMKEEEGEETREGGAVTKDGKEVVSPTAPRAEPEGPSKSDREALTAKIRGIMKEEQLDETSKKKAWIHAMAAKDEIADIRSKYGKRDTDWTDNDLSDKDKNTIRKRTAGLIRTAKKLTSEEAAQLEEKKLTEDKTEDSVIGNHRKMINYHKEMEKKHSGVRFDSLHSNAAYDHQNAIDDHEKAIERYKKNPNDIDYKLAALNAENSTKKAKESSDHLYVREDVDYEGERAFAEDKITLESVLAEIQANLGEAVGPNKSQLDPKPMGTSNFRFGNRPRPAGLTPNTTGMGGELENDRVRTKTADVLPNEMPLPTGALNPKPVSQLRPLTTNQPLPTGKQLPPVPARNIGGQSPASNPPTRSAQVGGQPQTNNMQQANPATSAPGGATGPASPSRSGATPTGGAGGGTTPGSTAPAPTTPRPAPRTRSIGGNQSPTNEPFDNSRAASQPGMQQAKDATPSEIKNLLASKTERAAQAAGYGDTEAFGRGSTPPPASTSRRRPAEPLPSSIPSTPPPASTGDEALASRPPAPPVAPATPPAVRRAAQPASIGSRAPEPTAPRTAAPEPAAPAEPKSRQMFQAAQDDDNPAAFFRADKQLSKERASMNESFEQFAKRFINEKR